MWCAGSERPDYHTMMKLEQMSGHGGWAGRSPATLLADRDVCHYVLGCTPSQLIKLDNLAVSDGCLPSFVEQVVPRAAWTLDPGPWTLRTC